MHTDVLQGTPNTHVHNPAIAYSSSVGVRPTIVRYSVSECTCLV